MTQNTKFTAVDAWTCPTAVLRSHVRNVPQCLRKRCLAVMSKFQCFIPEIHNNIVSYSTHQCFIENSVSSGLVTVMGWRFKGCKGILSPLLQRSSLRRKVKRKLFPSVLTRATVPQYLEECISKRRFEMSAKSFLKASSCQKSSCPLFIALLLPFWAQWDNNMLVWF